MGATLALNGLNKFFFQGLYLTFTGEVLLILWNIIVSRAVVSWPSDSFLEYFSQIVAYDRHKFCLRFDSSFYRCSYYFLVKMFE